VDDTPSTGFTEIYFRKWDGANWIEVPTGSASGGGFSNTVTFNSFSPSLIIGPDGKLMMSWEDQGIYFKKWE
jgi:hypothetical protein